MSSLRKVQASAMLASLSADRFKLFSEAELIPLAIPYELRRATQNEALKLRKERPWDHRHFPKLSGAASGYYELRGTALRESLYSNNYRAKHLEAVQQQILADAACGPFDLPARFVGPGVLDLFDWHRQQIANWVFSLQSAWDKMSEVERLWFETMPPVCRWAFDFPGLAPAPHCFYPTEETPERARQKRLLEWVIQDCGGDE